MQYHLHNSETGTLVKCYHKTKSMLTSVEFYVATTISFPIEHFIWEKLPGFSWVTHWIGL